MPGIKIVRLAPDWADLGALEDAEVERMAIADTDSPATDEDHWAQATIGLPSGKIAIHASFDREVVDFFKQGGRGYQTRMNAVLRRYMEVQQAKKASGSVGPVRVALAAPSR